MDCNMKYKILIVGAGQLGSRHLQGALKVLVPIDVFVIDPSNESLAIAAQRANEIDHNHTIKYQTDWNNLPAIFDIVIIATNSNIREKVINQLLEKHEVRYLILEKVVFPEIDAYKRVDELFNKHNIQVWVNHPRRMFESYLELKNELSNTPKVFQVTGGNWGLGCNGLHFIDLFAFLTSSKVCSIDTQWVDENIQESKRSGFIEFSGTIKGTLEDNSIFIISSLQGETSATTITIFDNPNRYLIQEGGTLGIYSLRKENNFKCEFNKFEIGYQSTLSTKLVCKLLEEAICDLPTFKEACDSHIPFVEQLLNKFNSINKITTQILPIT